MIAGSDVFRNSNSQNEPIETCIRFLIGKTMRDFESFDFIWKLNAFWARDNLSGRSTVSAARLSLLTVGESHLEVWGNRPFPFSDISYV